VTARDTITVLLTPAADVTREGASLLARVRESDPEAPVRIVALGRAPEAVSADLVVPRDRLTRVLHAVGGDAISRRLADSPAGRLLNSLGPMHPGRVAWRSLRGSRQVRELLGRTRLLVAADDDSALPAWKAVRAGLVPEARFDPAAARVLASGSGV